MEGKELYNEDDNNEENKKITNEPDSEDFGLPEIDDDSSKKEGVEDSTGSSYPSYESSEEETPEPTYEDQFLQDVNESDSTSDSSTEGGYQPSYTYDDEGGGNSALWIILVVVLLITAAVLVYWFVFRSEPEPIVEEKPAVIEQPVVIPEDTMPAEIIDEPVEDFTNEPEAGDIIELTEPTGNYYVVIASFIDDDLAMDYGKKLADEGQGSYILSPKGQKKFYRLAVAELSDINTATLRAEQLKSDYGDEVWVMKY